MPVSLKFVKAHLCIVTAFVACSASATPLQPAAPAPVAFMVSGMVQKSGTTVVKLVQAVEVAETKVEAVKIFSQQVTNAFPGRVLIDVIAAPVPTQAKSCGLSI